MNTPEARGGGCHLREDSTTSAAKCQDYRARGPVLMEHNDRLCFVALYVVNPKSWNLDRRASDSDLL